MEKIDEIIKLSADRNSNEADVRFKIIDTILRDILSWPLNSVSCEKYVEGNRADYVLTRKNNTPALIIEAKKDSIYFELPETPNSKKNYQKVLVEKLISDSNIKSAILQVKEYCDDLGCSYGAISNGHEWVFFHVNPQNKPWKQLPAFVIRNLNFFKEDYTTAKNLFGYESIINQNSLRKNIGFVRTGNDEIYYPKNSIITYNTPVNSNKYAHILSTLSRKYLGVIPIDDDKFMSNCYVTNKGHYDDLQKNVQGFVFDSLTPFFKAQGVRDFSDDKKGGAFAIKIQEIIKKENLDNVMILFGGRGSGKSTFLKRFFYYIKPTEIEMYAQLSLVDLLNAAQEPTGLTKDIWEKVLQTIDTKNILEQGRNELLNLYNDKFELFAKQFLAGLSEDSMDYQRLVSDFIIKQKEDIKYTCERLSFQLKAKGKGLIIILDNLDQFPPNLQDVCFLTATEIAKKLGCLLIISMREERFYRVKTKGVLDAYNPPGYHLTSPVIPDVLIKRLYYILDILKITPDLETDFNIKNDNELTTIISFLEICKNEIRRRHSALSTFLRYSTHGDVRMALDFFKGFITSGYTNINEMAPFSDWKFQIHQVIKPMMIPDRFFYDERLSKVPNVFQIRNESNSSHFSGLRLLDMLNNKSNDKPSGGFVDAKYIVQKFDNDFNLKEDAEKHMDIFLARGLVESSNRLEEYNETVDQIRITAFGKYFYENLCLDFTYLDLVSLDCGIYDEDMHHRFVRDASRELDLYFSGNFMERIKLRLNRVDMFINYLIKQEDKEFSELNLSGEAKQYGIKLYEHFKKQRTKIEKSAQRKLENEYY